jgi:hypothetical protein
MAWHRGSIVTCFHPNPRVISSSNQPRG